MGSLVVRDSWFTRTLRFLRLLTTDDAEHVAGADFAEHMPAAHGYSPESAMSALAAFPWVFACVNARATDLAGLPIVVHRGRGEDAEPIDHPVMDLLDRPTSRIPGVLWRRQLLVDFTLTGTAYQYVGGAPEPASLLRLHPNRSKLLPLEDGQPGDLEYSGRGRKLRYPWERVLLFRRPSWEDTPGGLYGTGAIQTLHNDLTTDLAVSKMAATSASEGKPTGLITPKDKDDRWSGDQVKILRAAYEKQIAGKSGVLFLGGAAQYEALGWSPRDMEYEKVRLYARDAVLAALDVPPSRVGLPTANYATSREQAQRYWESLQGDAALIDAELTRLARMYRGSERVYVRHDFSGVDALQEARTARLNRVQQWWLMGVPLNEAAALEGFENVNVSDEAEAPRPAVPAEDDDQRAIVRFLTAAPERRETEPARAIPTDEAARKALSDVFIRTVHTPTERAYTVVMRRFLRAQSERYAERVAEVLGEGQRAVGGGVVMRAISDEEMELILAEADEAILLGTATRPTMRDAIRRAFLRAVREIGIDGLEWTPALGDPLIDAQLGKMVQQVGDTTKEAVRAIVLKLEAEGGTIAEMQTALQQMPEFSPMRALRIARTETTRSITGGSLAAYGEAKEAGVDLKVQWLSARDEHVRDLHVELDGQEIETGGMFEVDGESAPGPGQFARADLTVNCRCTVIPVLPE